MCQPRTPRPPGRLPRRFAGLGRLPQHEVERVALRLVHVDARAGAQVREPLARELPVRREARHGVVHVAIGACVGVTLVNQCLHHCDDLRQVLGRARLMVRACHAERLAVLAVGADESLGERGHRLAVLRGALDDLVVDVSDVAHERDAVTGGREMPSRDVECDQHAGVTEMAVVIDRHATHVHADFARHDRLERFLAAGQRIVDLRASSSVSGIQFHHVCGPARRAASASIARDDIAAISPASGASLGPWVIPVSAERSGI